MKVLIIGDTEVSYIWDHFDPARFKGVELILSSGDIRADYLEFLVTMLNVPLLYVPGNHDERYLQKSPGGCINIDNKIFKYKDLRILGMGGSMRYKPGPFQYTDREMKMRLFKMKRKLWTSGGIDILLAHAPAEGLGDGVDLCHKGFKAFNQILDKYKPRFFVHGHQHLNYGDGQRVIKYHDTTIINSYGYYIFDY